MTNILKCIFYERGIIVFRSFIYLDEDKLYGYKRLLDGGYVQPKSINKKKVKSAAAGISKSALSYTDEESSMIEYEKDPFWDYDRFELSLSNLEGEDFYDFIVNEDMYDITSVQQMKIIKLGGNVEIPEEFDVFNLIESFKPLLIDQIEIKSDSDRNMLNSVLGDAKADIPVLLGSGEVTVVGRLNTKWLLEDYTALEEYDEQKITALCKVIGITRQERVTIFNPLKDFIKLNRAMRRAGSFENGEGFDPIIIDGPVVKVEIIALYK